MVKQVALGWTSRCNNYVENILIKVFKWDYITIGEGGNERARVKMKSVVAFGPSVGTGRIDTLTKVVNGRITAMKTLPPVIKGTEDTLVITWTTTTYPENSNNV